MIQPEDHEKILAHLKDCFYYKAFYRIGFTKDMDHEMHLIFVNILNNGSNLSFYAEDKATGKVSESTHYIVKFTKLRLGLLTQSIQFC